MAHMEGRWWRRRHTLLWASRQAARQEIAFFPLRSACCAHPTCRRPPPPPLPRRPCRQALTALGCMEHRGACSADDVSGDGAGIMTKVPWGLFKAEMPQLNEATTG